jgi:hypothetical protein
MVAGTHTCSAFTFTDDSLHCRLQYPCLCTSSSRSSGRLPTPVSSTRLGSRSYSSLLLSPYFYLLSHMRAYKVTVLADGGAATHDEALAAQHEANQAFATMCSATVQFPPILARNLTRSIKALVLAHACNPHIVRSQWWALWEHSPTLE